LFFRKSRINRYKKVETIMVDLSENGRIVCVILIFMIRSHILAGLI